jgi:membrane protease YdiL (CAAX protease family)
MLALVEVMGNAQEQRRIPFMSKRILVVARASALALLILVCAQGIWGVLNTVNLMLSPAIPWSVPAMAVVLWLIWQYLSGKGWPRSTAQARRQLLRAKPVSRQVLAWTMLTGVCSTVALAGYWIVMFRLFQMAPNTALPDFSRYPLLTSALTIVMIALVSPVSEEAAFRGYCQSMLERTFRGPAAPVLLSALLFALAHLTQGFFLPKLFVYFLAGVAIGAGAYITRSILPGIPAHMITDLTFLIFVWPYDAGRRVIWETGADGWFWLHVAQALLFTILTLLAFRQLARVAKGAAAHAQGEPLLSAASGEASLRTSPPQSPSLLTRTSAWSAGEPAQVELVAGSPCSDTHMKAP